MRGDPANPGCVLPSIVTASVRGGRALDGAIDATPLPIEKVISSGPGVAFASDLMMAVPAAKADDEASEAGLAYTEENSVCRSAETAR